MRPFGMKLALQAFILCGVASVASASMITDPFSFTQANATTTNFDMTFGVPLFDTGLGTLTAVNIQVTYTGTIGYSINNPAGSKTFTDTQPLSLTFEIATPAGITVPVSLSGLLCPSGCAVPVGTTNFTGPGTGSNSGPATGALAAFEAAGGGTLTLHSVFDGQGSGTFSLVGTGPAANTTPIANLSVTGSVAYTYTPAVTGSAPEPATMVLVGFALLGAGVVFRRKARKEV